MGEKINDGGVPLRDWFAAMASEEDLEQIPTSFWVGDECRRFNRAERRYFHADLMIAARNKDTSND